MSCDGWGEFKLGNLLNFRRGHDLTKSDMRVGEIPVVGSNGIIGYHHQFTTKKPCLTIGRSGNVGNPLYINQDCWAHNTTLYVDDFKLNDPKYLYFLLKTLDLNNFGGGSAVPTLNRNHIHPIMVIATRNKIEQKIIASILSSLDDKIELNNKINKTLEEMAQTIFKRWFIDFEFPDENGQPYKSSGGDMVDSEMGLIPKGWNTHILSEILSTRKEKAGDRNIPEYSSTNIGIFPRSEKFTKQLAKTGTNNKVIHKNDLVFGMSRQILNWGIMTANIGAVSSAYDVFEVNQSIVPSEYLKLYMTHKITYFMDIIKPAAREGQGIDKSLLLSKSIYIPSMSIFNEFLKLYSSIHSTINLKINEINRLIDIRDSLLPKLMSGEIRVPIENEVS